MTKNDEERNAILLGVRVLDGGMASELEYQGANIDGPLWSAHVLEDAPEKVIAVHRAYINAGADCILTASYQVSRMGYAEVGLSTERADAALLKSVALARAAADEFPRRRIVVAASLGPYGAALHNGAEYHGNYGIGFSELVAFHRERIQVLAAASSAPYVALKGHDFSRAENGPQNSGALASGGSFRKLNQRPDLFAFETLPSLEEALAIGEALSAWPALAAWFSFTCKDGRHVAHGELLSECASAVAKFPQTVAVGVNCTQPALIPALIGELRAGSAQPIVVYPNSGEGWDAENRCWTGKGDPESYGEQAKTWFNAGAQIVGGCCRSRTAHIRQVAQAVLRT